MRPAAVLQDLQNCFERELLDSISDPVVTLQILVTLKILSSHAADEEYIDKEEHSYIKVQRTKASNCLQKACKKEIGNGLCARQSCTAASCASDVTARLEQASSLLLLLLLV